MVAAAGFGLLWVLIGPSTAMLGVALALLVVIGLTFTPAVRLDRAGTEDVGVPA